MKSKRNIKLVLHMHGSKALCFKCQLSPIPQAKHKQMEELGDGSELLHLGPVKFQLAGVRNQCDTLMRVHCIRQKLSEVEITP